MNRGRGSSRDMWRGEGHVERGGICGEGKKGKCSERD